MTGLNHLGKKVKLRKAGLADTLDIEHTHLSFLQSYNHGRMNGFDLVPVGSGITDTNYAYQYVDPAQIAPYRMLASRYTLADHFFQTQSSGSFTAHQDLIAGSTDLTPSLAVIDVPTQQPWGCDAPPGTTTPVIDAAGKQTGNGPFPCYSWLTLRDRLDDAKISWKYYTPPEPALNGGQWWNAFLAVRNVYDDKSEWSTNISSPSVNVLRDVAAGTLPAVSWVVPDVENSDHPGKGSTNMGPSWVASIVNAIGKSHYWNNTAIVIAWDDWGGFYDEVPPPKERFDGPGFRVPCIIVSAYARRSYVSHTEYQFGSILRFIENDWSLQSLGTTDATSNSIDDAFDFTGKPRAFQPVPAKYPARFFLHQRPSGRPVDTE
jgi:phospholipase C